MSWLDHPALAFRYPAQDMSDGGYRLRSALPLLVGTIGTVHRRLPEGTPCSDSIMITWARQRPDGGWDLGVQRIDAS